jgi:hypothetical protein
MRYMIVAGLLLAFAGAAMAEIPRAPLEQDTAGKQFNPPPPGMAAVYFYRPVAAGPGINVFVGQNEIGWLAPQTWMRVELSPGWHAMRCSLEYVADPESIRMTAGDMRFVAVDRPAGQARCSIRETASDVGRVGVMQGFRVLQRQ